MARPSKYVTRSDLGWGSSPADAADPRSGLVVHYDSVDQGLAGKAHSACLTYWRNTRAFHTGPNRGWADVGYSFMGCAHGYVIEGRGLRRYQAAQGTTAGNSSYYSVTLATGPTDTITDAQINAVRELRQWLIQNHGNAGTVLGHRDFVATSCPGDKAYALVRNGTFAQPPGVYTEGDEELLGLKEGDKGESVKALQTSLRHAGFTSIVGEVDGIYGPATSAAVLAARQMVGSTATSGTSVTGSAAAQIRRAVARREAQDAVAGIEFPECTCSGGGDGGGLPAKATISGTVNLKGA